MQLAIKWFDVRLMGGSAGMAAARRRAEAALRALMAENQHLTDITLSLLKPLKPQVRNTTPV